MSIDKKGETLQSTISKVTNMIELAKEKGLTDIVLKESSDLDLDYFPDVAYHFENEGFNVDFQNSPYIESKRLAIQWKKSNF